MFQHQKTKHRFKKSLKDSDMSSGLISLLCIAAQCDLSWMLLWPLDRNGKEPGLEMTT